MVVATSIIAGASGGALANVALSPLGGGAGFIQSYWYGAGLILGERDMYTFHWEKIKARLSAGEDYLSVLESEMNPAITAIANYSLQIMQRTGSIYIKGGIDFMAQLIENMFKIIAGETITEPVPEPIPEPVEPPLVQCPSGFRWSISAQQCVPEDIPEPEPTPTDPLIPQEPVADRTENAKYQVSPLSFCFGYMRSASLSGTTGWKLYSNTDRDTANGNWIVVAQDISKGNVETKGNASWPSPAYFKFNKTINGLVFTFWALDLS